MSINSRLPGAERLLEKEVLSRLQDAGRRGRAPARLAAATGADRGEVEAALTRLAKQGTVLVIEGRWVAVEAAGWVLGVVDEVDRGEALVRPLTGRRVEYLVSRRRRKGASEGDRVLLEVAGERRRRGGEALEAAAVVQLLGQGHRRLVGTLEIDEDERRWLVPFDTKSNLEVEVEGADHLLEETFVVVEVEPGAGSPLIARVVEVLGRIDQPGVDTLVVLRHFDIPEVLAEEALAAAARLPEDPQPADFAGREDLRRDLLITIDGESARDFDDAVSIERLGGGAFRLGVHIADVSHYVAEGSALDAEAYRRGTSVYFPERAVPMLPEALSNGLCSLRPEVPRLTLSVFLDFDGEGRLEASRFAETVIQSARRMTYDEVRRLLEEPQPEDRQQYGRRLLAVLGDLAELMRRLHARRSERGSIDFDLPAGDVVLDTDGYTVGITPGKRHVAHRIIEEMMIAANEAVAAELDEAGVPALYRVHDPPDRRALEELRPALATFGIKLAGEAGELSPRALQQVLERVEGRPEEDFVTALVLRSLARAVYSQECRGHYALASQHYTHFTSPIRRYPDLLVHRQLKARIGGGGGGGDLEERLEAIAEQCSHRERRAEAAEREVLQWKKVRFLADRVGERFSGRITGVQPFGLFIQLDGLFVDGLLPIRTLEDDYYLYDAEGHRLVGDNHGRVFQLADEVEVVLAGVSQRHRGLDFKLAEPSEPARRRRGRSKKRRRRGRG